MVPMCSLDRFDALVTSLLPEMVVPRHPIAVTMIEDRPKYGIGLQMVLSRWPDVTLYTIAPNPKHMPDIPRSAIILLDHDLGDRNGKEVAENITGIHIYYHLRNPYSSHAGSIIASITAHAAQEYVPDNKHFKLKMAVAHGDPDATLSFIRFMNRLIGHLLM